MSSPAITPTALFLAFSKIALCGFGGIMFWARRELVERRGWLTDREFAELLTLGQLLPGPPGLNITVMVGYRFSGFIGALASTAGILGWPCLVVVGMGLFYQQYGTLVQVRDALFGMSAVAAGLLIATAVKLATVLPRRVVPWLFAVSAFSGIALLRWPFLWVIGALAPLGIGAAWKAREK